MSEQYPPQPTAPVAAPVAAPAAAPRRKKGCLVAGAIGCAVVLVLACAAVAAAYFGFVSLGKPKDLGVEFTEADYWSAVEKAGVDFPPPPAEGEDWNDSEVVYSGTKPVDATFSSAEVSALLSNSHSGSWPIRDMQLRFNGGDNVEMSGYVTYQGTEYPVYVDADAGVSGRTISGSINSAQVMGITVPAEYLAVGEQYGLDILNGRLSRLEGLDISAAEVVDGQLHLEGMVPAKAERVTSP